MTRIKAKQKHTQKGTESAFVDGNNTLFKLVLKLNQVKTLNTTFYCKWSIIHLVEKKIYNYSLFEKLAPMLQTIS